MAVPAMSVGMDETPMLLKIHRHDDVNEIRAAFEQTRALRRRHFQPNLVAVNHAQRLGHELRVKPDLDVAPLKLAGKVDLRLARFGAAAGQLQAGLAEREADALAFLGREQRRAADGREK